MYELIVAAADPTHPDHRRARTDLTDQWGLAELEGVPARRFASAVRALEEMSVDRYPTVRLMWRAYELRDNVTAYDAAYVALAEALDCPLVTADARLAKAPGIRCEVEFVTSLR